MLMAMRLQAKSAGMPPPFRPTSVPRIYKSYSFGPPQRFFDIVSTFQLEPRLVAYFLTITIHNSSSAQVGDSAAPAPVSAPIKAAQQSGEFSQPNATQSPITSHNANLPNASNGGFGVTAAASITDANLAAAVLEATFIKSPTPAAAPNPAAAFTNANGVSSRG